MSTKMNIADTTEIERRNIEAREFYNAILDPYEHPWLITDKASLYDITLDEEDELIRRIYIYYGVKIDNKLIGEHFWKLLDYLKENRKK